MRDLEGYTEWDEPRKASRTEYNISMVEAIRKNGWCTILLLFIAELQNPLGEIIDFNLK